MKKSKHCYVIQDYAYSKTCCELVIEKLLRGYDPYGNPRNIITHGAKRNCIPSFYEKDYPYSENVQKFCDLIKILHSMKEYDVFFLIEHDCYISNVKKLDELFYAIEDNEAAVYGTLHYGSKIIEELLFTHHRYFMIGSNIILTRKCLDLLVEFINVYEDRLELWGESCDYFLNSFCSKHNIMQIPMNRFFRSCGDYNPLIFNPWNSDECLYHKITPYLHATIVSIENNETCFPKNTIESPETNLFDLEYKFFSKSNLESIETRTDYVLVPVQSVILLNVNVQNRYCLFETDIEIMEMEKGTEGIFSLLGNFINNKFYSLPIKYGSTQKIVRAIPANLENNLIFQFFAKRSVGPPNYLKLINPRFRIVKELEYYNAIDKNLLYMDSFEY